MFETMNAALLAAKHLKTRMDRPDDWLLNVWENLGWHYCLNYKYGHLSVWPRNAYRGIGKASYGASLSPLPSGHGTPGEWIVGRSFSNPNQAVRAQIKRLKEDLSGRQKVYDTIVKAITKEDADARRNR